jgi:hypothetical protein
LGTDTERMQKQKKILIIVGYGAVVRVIAHDLH